VLCAAALGDVHAALGARRRACTRKVTEVVEPAAGEEEQEAEEAEEAEEVEEAGGEEEEQTGGGDGEDQEGEWERQRRLRREEAALESLIDSELQIEKVIKWASEEEFELRRRFCKYAAMTIACCEKDREMRVSANCCRGDTWWNAAYWQSLGEFESCCESGTGKPHWKLLCVGCQEVVCRCTCTVECACGQQIAKWGWVKDAQICY
jgi:hypothetical protein